MAINRWKSNGPAMGWIAFSLIVGAIGVGFLVNFKGFPRRLYDGAVRFWAKTPAIGLNYRRIMPFSISIWRRYGSVGLP